MKPEWEWDTWYDPEFVDPYVSALGRLVIVFGEVEWILEQFTATFFRGDPSILRLVSGNSTSWYCERIEVLAADRLGQELAVSMKAWVTKARIATQERNRVVHCRWHRPDETSAFSRVRTQRKGQVVAVLPTSPEDVLDVVALGIEVLGEAQELWQQWVTVLAPPPP